MQTNDYGLKFTPLASDVLEQIYSYVSHKLLAQAAADNLLVKIESSIMSLAGFPYSGSVLLEESLKTRGYRKLIVDNYLIFYLINELDKHVVIMRIMYGVQNYTDLL